MQSKLACSFSILMVATAANAQIGSFIKSGNGCPNAGTSAATDILAADDTVNGPHALGWTFPYIGGAGSTMSIDIAPNGYIYLEAGTNTLSRCCNGSAAGVPIADFLSATPSIACFGQDLNASASGAGSVHFETNNLDEATITWDHVLEFGNSTVNTIVCTLRLDGTIEIEWNNCSLETHQGLVGYSEGGGVLDNGGGDWSASPIVGVAGEALYEAFDVGTFDLSNTSVILIPTGGSYTVVPGPVPPARDPITLDSMDLPTIGATMTLDILDTPASTIVNAIFFGDANIGPIPLPGAPGCDVYTNATLGSLSGVASSFALPVPSTITLIGAVLEAQGISLVPGINPLQIVSSNLGTLTVGDQPVGLTFGTNGANSFNADTTSGFWSLQNSSGLDVTSLTVDFSVNLAGKLFDTDQTGMADRFDGGNSAVVGCLGTYRNTSDVATGLVYAGTPAAPCDATANAGWIGSNGSTAGNFETLDFTFTDFNNGETFEFDVDTDGIGGIGGDDMAGTVITITLSDGSVHIGTIAANGADSGIVIL